MNSFAKLFFILLFSSNIINATEIANDQYDYNLDGWSGSGVYHFRQGLMYVYRDSTGSKTYDFDSSYANQILTISFRAWVPDSWETDDDFNILVNNSVQETYHTGGGLIEETFTATADANGDIKIGFNPDSSYNNEPLYVDWITINATPVSNIAPTITDGIFSIYLDASVGTLIGTVSSI